MHVELNLTKVGALRKDDCGRPKLKTRKHDWNVGGGFLDVSRRHGQDSQEVKNVRQAVRLISDTGSPNGQQLFDFWPANSDGPIFTSDNGQKMNADELLKDAHKKLAM